MRQADQTFKNTHGLARDLLCGVQRPLKDYSMTCRLKTFQGEDDKSDCGERNISLDRDRERATSKCQLVQKYFNGCTLFSICLGESQSAVSGAEMNGIIHKH